MKWGMFYDTGDYAVFETPGREEAQFPIEGEEERRPLVYRTRKEAIEELVEYAEELNEARIEGRMDGYSLPHPKYPFSRETAEDITGAYVRKLTEEDMDLFDQEYGGVWVFKQGD